MDLHHKRDYPGYGTLRNVKGNSFIHIQTFEEQGRKSYHQGNSRNQSRQVWRIDEGFFFTVVFDV